MVMVSLMVKAIIFINRDEGDAADVVCAQRWLEEEALLSRGHEIAHAL